MEYCKSCLQTNSRPGILFDKEGICPACNYFKTLKKVDWDKRKRQLDKIVAFGKENRSSDGYDCIIGVSGGKDSLRQAIFVKEILGMNPLLVCLSYPPKQIAQRGVDNLSNLINKGFDCTTIQPAPGVWRDLMHKSFFEYTNWARSTELALFSSVPRMAIAYQIPLIWWGDNPALQIGDLGVMGKNGWDGNNTKNLNTLSGGNYKWMLNKNIKTDNILQYLYPSDKEMERAKLQIVYLGYFWNIWSLRDNGFYAALHGLNLRSDKPWESGDHAGVSSVDEDWVTVNQMIKYLKYGFGKVSEYVNEDIRNKRITRNQGIDLIKKYDGKCSTKYIKSFCDFIGISFDEFWWQVDKSVNYDLFLKKNTGEYQPLFEVGKGN
ncbi:N-acetyl sugar amidotransferase [Pelagibacterales bacterium SAG-MED49]|nr:N-acetyl sugar amidotransferase [Pelagibacterales bacterium SAG-MED49]